MLLRMIAFALVTATPALAADALETERPPLDPVTGWTGAYLGLLGGVATSDGEARLGDFGGAVIEHDVRQGLFHASSEDRDTGASFGAAVGYNIQYGRFVGSLEADISSADIDSRAEYSEQDGPWAAIPIPTTTLTDYKTSIDTLATVRARFGIAFDGTLVYGTGGLAAGHVFNSFSVRVPELNNYASPSWSESGARTGYVVGGGVEQKITPRLALKAEAMYFDLEDETIDGVDPAAFPGQSISYEFDNDGAIGRIGLNFSF